MDPIKEIGRVSVGFNNIEFFSGELKDACHNGWEHSVQTVLEFENARDELMFYHQTALNFIFKKMQCLYGFDIDEWDVSDCLQFTKFENVDENIEGFKSEAAKSDAKRVLEECRLNGPDMISMRQIYKGNDPYALDLRIKVKELHELFKNVIFDWKSKSEVNLFLQEIADHLWGFGKYTKGMTDETKHRKIYKKMDVLEVTGASGNKGKTLNGMYVETDQFHNGRKLYKKVSMFRGMQHWLCSTVENKWVITETENVEKNDRMGLCRGETKYDDPTQIKWRVYDADKEKTWKSQ